jgi:hypothetical protein
MEKDLDVDVTLNGKTADIKYGMVRKHPYL